MKKPNGYWNYEICKQTALKYTTKKELKEKVRSCYTTILSKKWYELMDHMISLGNLYNRCIYVYEFNNNYAYIGLTLNLEKRDKQHRTDKSSSVYKFIKDNNVEPNLIKLSDYIINSSAIKLELETIEKYKNNGWFLLNKVKGGSLGATKKIWTKEKCKTEALKYNNKKDFRENSYSVYKTSVKNNWLNDITKHMIETKKPKGYWTFEKCLDEASKYETKLEFIKKSPNCYKISIRNKWINDITKHMTETKKPKGYWTFEKCLDEANKYINIKEFRKKSPNPYKIAYRKGWLENIFNNK